MEIQFFHLYSLPILFHNPHCNSSKWTHQIAINMYRILAASASINLPAKPEKITQLLGKKTLLHGHGTGRCRLQLYNRCIRVSSKEIKNNTNQKHSSSSCNTIAFRSDLISSIKNN